MSMSTSPGGGDNSTALERFGHVMSYLQYENSMYWERGNFFMVASTALFGFMATNLLPLGATPGWEKVLVLLVVSVGGGALTVRPAPGLIFHSDRGVEFSAYAFRARLAALGITQSMKRPREIGDNAFIESFFHTLKADVIHGHVFDNDHALRTAISRYTRRYNRTRMHSALDYRSPIDYERLAA